MPQRELQITDGHPTKSALQKSRQCQNCWKEEKPADGPQIRMMRCGGCIGNQWYCSKECQKADWSNHKHLCGSAELCTKQMMKQKDRELGTVPNIDLPMTLTELNKRMDMWTKANREAFEHTMINCLNLQFAPERIKTHGCLLAVSLNENATRLSPPKSFFQVLFADLDDFKYLRSSSAGERLLKHVTEDSTEKVRAMGGLGVAIMTIQLIHPVFSRDFVPRILTFPYMAQPTLKQWPIDRNWRERLRKEVLPLGAEDTEQKTFLQIGEVLKDVSEGLAKLDEHFGSTREMPKLDLSSLATLGRPERS